MQDIIVTSIYWALFGFAVIGAVGSIIFALGGRWGWLAICLGMIVPYAGMWVMDYGSNCLIRKEIPVAVTLVSASVDESADGRNVVVRLTPQPRTFYDAPTGFEFSNFGAIDNRPVTVIDSRFERGIDGLITTVDVELFVPNLGSAATRLDAVGFGQRRYIAKSPVLPFETHYATD